MVSIKYGEASNLPISLGGLVKDTLHVDDGREVGHAKLGYIQICFPWTLAWKQTPASEVCPQKVSPLKP